MQKKSVQVGQLTRNVVYTFFCLIFAITSCRDKQSREKRDVNAITAQSKDEKVLDTSLVFLGIQSADTITFPKKEFLFLESLIGPLKIATIESCPAKVERYQRLFSQDSVLNLYKINICDQHLLCEILFGTNSNNRVFHLGDKSLSKKSVTSFNALIPDSLNLQIGYEYSHYFKITTRDNFLLIVSKSEQWTGKMSNYSLFQLVDLNSLIIYEFVHS